MKLTLLFWALALTRSVVSIREAREFKSLKLQQVKEVLTITLDNESSGVNVWPQLMSNELDTVVNSLRNDSSTKVVIFRSGNPEFFIAHMDVITQPGQPAADVEFSTRLFYNITTLSQPTIALVEGPARGIGNEFLAAVDMRFASKGAIFGNIEITFGEHPATGGAAWMASHLTRGRAMEYLLSGGDLDAETAEHWGYINRAFESSAELNDYVTNLANRIALFPVDAIVSLKATINALSRPSWDHFAFDSSEWIKLLTNPLQQRLLQSLVVLTKNQTDVDVELNFGEEAIKIYEA